jgi:hypothetical protein
VSGAHLVTLLAWVGVAVVGVFLAAWARYFIVRNGPEEEVARLRVPIAATVVLVVLLVVLAVAQPPAAT